MLPPQIHHAFFVGAKPIKCFARHPVELELGVKCLSVNDLPGGSGFGVDSIRVFTNLCLSSFVKNRFDDIDWHERFSAAIRLFGQKLTGTIQIRERTRLTIDSNG